MTAKTPPHSARAPPKSPPTSGRCAFAPTRSSLRSTPSGLWTWRENFCGSVAGSGLLAQGSGWCRGTGSGWRSRLTCSPRVGRDRASHGYPRELGVGSVTMGCACGETVVVGSSGSHQEVRRGVCEGGEEGQRQDPGPGGRGHRMEPGPCSAATPGTARSAEGSRNRDDRGLGPAATPPRPPQAEPQTRRTPVTAGERLA